MKEQFGNIWDLAGPDDVIVITTNGYVKRGGGAVMGRGIALQAAQKDREVPYTLGILLQEFGNHVHVIKEPMPLWLSFPVKEHWKDQANLELIEQSTKELVEVIDQESRYTLIMNVYLPRPGCGNGRRKWEEVKPILEKYLDDRFIVVTNE